MKILFLIFFLSQTLFADENGNPILNTVSCDGDAFSSAEFICDLFTSLGGADLCTVTAKSCVVGSQEIFVGNQIELASPGNIKNWTGFGGLGLTYQAANLCLLRDLKDGLISSGAKASTFLGDVKIKQTIKFLSFDRTNWEWIGYHRGQACAPVVGCLDVFTQKIKVKAVSTNLTGQGFKVGEYQIFSSHGLDMTADGIAQSMKVQIPAISVVTPYGVITANPEFNFGRAMGFILSPFEGGNKKSSASGIWGTAKLFDLYGRKPGTLGSGVYPTYGVFADRVVDNRVIGYLSPIAFGSRDANPKSSAWTPGAGVEFPFRPDADYKKARSGLEKFPNAYLGANIKLSYSPTDLIPAVIRNNGFITIDFTVWAKPLIDTAFTSQFDILNTEISKANKLLLPGGPLDYRPNNMDQFKGVNLFAGSSAAARTALEAGVDLKIHLYIDLFFTDIDIDLINIHPKTTVLEKITTGFGAGNKSAGAFSQATQIVSSGNLFQLYKRFNGVSPIGQAHIQECLAAPDVAMDPPDDPNYTPGNPEDLTKNILYPCNICVGMNPYTYKDDNNVNHTIPGFLKTMFPASQNGRPTNVRWTCDMVYESGCYDMCSFNTVSGTLTVVKTARELLASGEAANMPGRCR